MDADIHKCYDTLVDSCSHASLNGRYPFRRSSDMLVEFIVKTSDHFMVSLLWFNLSPFRVVEISIRRYAKETENMMPISSTVKRSIVEVWAELLIVLRFSISSWDKLLIKPSQNLTTRLFCWKRSDPFHWPTLKSHLVTYTDITIAVGTVG